VRKISFVALVIAVVFLAQVLFFYRGVYFPPSAKAPDFLSIEINLSKQSDIGDAFTKGSGTVLIDMSHENNFDSGELNLLLSRILARGYRVEYFRDGSNLKSNLSNSNSFVVISPTSSFSSADAKAVKEFVDGGGRLFMLSEPVRGGEINSLASEFGILFWDDYLYNLKENDGNFRYIYLTDFAEGNITRGLQKLVFYTSSSVFGNGIIFTSSDTYSSSRMEKGRYAVAALAEDSKVLAIGDITFMSEPYNVADNNRLVYNIADFLAPPAEAKPEGIPADVSNATVANTTEVPTITG